MHCSWHRGMLICPWHERIWDRCRSPGSRCWQSQSPNMMFLPSFDPSYEVAPWLPNNPSGSRSKPVTGHSLATKQTDKDRQTNRNSRTYITYEQHQIEPCTKNIKNAVQKRIFCNVPSWSKSLKKFGYSETTTCGPIWTGSRVTPSIQLRARPPRIERLSRTVTFRPLLARVTLLQDTASRFKDKQCSPQNPSNK